MIVYGYRSFSKNFQKHVRRSYKYEIVYEGFNPKQCKKILRLALSTYKTKFSSKKILSIHIFLSPLLCIHI